MRMRSATHQAAHSGYAIRPGWFRANHETKTHPGTWTDPSPGLRAKAESLTHPKAGLTADPCALFVCHGFGEHGATPAAHMLLSKVWSVPETAHRL